MGIRDRRSGRERRGSKRHSVNIEIEWEGLIGRKSGTVSDISKNGCFILCAGEVEDGESIKIFLPLADGMKIQFWAKVVNHVFEIGFAARFIEMSDAQKDFLKKLFATL
jgi:hypothetical protein